MFPRSAVANHPHDFRPSFRVVKCPDLGLYVIRVVSDTETMHEGNKSVFIIRSS